MIAPPEAQTARLEDPLRFLHGVGPKIGERLAKKGLRTLEDVLLFLPRAYEDRRQIRSIASLVEGENAVVFGKVTRAKAKMRRGRSKWGGGGFEATVQDATGSLELRWFHVFRGLEEEILVGTELLLYGSVSSFGVLRQIVHPDFEVARRDPDGKIAPSAHFGRVVPVYSEAEGLPQKLLRKIAAQALRASTEALKEDPLPVGILQKLSLPALRESILDVHYPAVAPALRDDGELERTPSRCRLAFEELFLLELALGLRRAERQKEKGVPVPEVPARRKAFEAALPFSVTGDQRLAMDAIAADLARTMPMVRLLQGDVGAGKTVVALAAAHQTAGAKLQTAILAPTELLAEQHARTAERILGPIGTRSALLTASNSSDKEMKRAIEAGEIDLVIGTHAIFQEAVKYKRLGLVVIDEQHRFGVAQRNALLAKAHGFVPHLLLMTATPIPRTLALTAYGDLEVTILREKPVGRQPIETTILYERDRPKMYKILRETAERGEQAYVIYPLVEESEKLAELKSATEMFERMRKEIFPDLRLALVHGRLSADDKNAALEAFRSGAISILISTTVVEVGIDVPNATLLVVEHPERLGLSQLHQLRGRVGRGAKKSRCILLAEKSATERLRVLVRSEDGFEIAEEDLRLRGPGEFLGTRQSGLPGFRLADLARDAVWLERAKTEADRVLQEDPSLVKSEHASLAHALKTRWRERLDWLRSG